jgi:hypothetical protein
MMRLENNEVKHKDDDKPKKENSFTGFCTGKLIAEQTHSAIRRCH